MEKNMCCNKKWADFGLLALRVTVGVVFLVHGWAKINDITSFAGMLDAGGWPAAAALAWLVALLETVGGIALILGIYVRLFAKLFVLEMLVALLVVHTKFPWSEAELAFVLLGGSLAIAKVGGGKYQVMKKECICGDMKGKKKMDDHDKMEDKKEM